MMQCEKMQLALAGFEGEKAPEPRSQPGTQESKQSTVEIPEGTWPFGMSTLAWWGPF